MPAYFVEKLSFVALRAFSAETRLNKNNGLELTDSPKMIEFREQRVFQQNRPQADMTSQIELVLCQPYKLGSVDTRMFSTRHSCAGMVIPCQAAVTQ